MVAVKLIAYPALAWAVLRATGLDPDWVASGTLLAALPTAAYAFVFAQRFEAAPDSGLGGDPGVDAGGGGDLPADGLARAALAPRPRLEPVRQRDVGDDVGDGVDEQVLTDGQVEGWWPRRGGWSRRP